MLQGAIGDAASCHDSVNLQLHELHRKRGRAIHLPVAKARFDSEILALDVTKVAHALHERFIAAGIQRRLPRTEIEKSDAPYLSLRLRDSAERHHECAHGNACNERAPVDH